MSGNYWMNLVKIDEMVDGLIYCLRPLLKNIYKSEDEIMLDVFYNRNQFFQLHPEYNSLIPFISIECEITQEANFTHIYYKLDNIIIKKLGLNG